MTPSTFTDAARTTRVRPRRPSPAITSTGPDAVLASLLDELEHPVDPQEARRILLGCLQDLSGYPAGALPELAFRLLHQRMSAPAESTVPPLTR
jgi:hypothetical protein